MAVIKESNLPFYEQKGKNIHMRKTSYVEFPKHLHSQVEITLVLSGKVEAWADSKGGIVSQGHAFIAFPNQVHHFKNSFGNADCILAIFPVEAIPAFNKIFLNQLPKNPIIPINLDLIIPIINTVFSEIEKDNPYRDTLLQGSLSIILSHILSGAELENSPKHDLTSIQAILRYCTEHYNEAVTLDTIARHTHLSKYYISHIFSSEVGISLPKYINSLRINEAEKLIQKGDLSITEIAFKVGFNSIRSFNRDFLAITGITPSKARQNIKQKG